MGPGWDKGRTDDSALTIEKSVDSAQRESDELARMIQVMASGLEA
jgi:hypothetical protein